jgi:AmmeMemoRadiSam system protein B/AmmeMemoRadiSam system protein A
MTVVRQPAVAGKFYSDDPAELRAAVRNYLDAAASDETATASPPKAIIVPHAGYVYSGSVAGSGYALLEELRGTIARVVLLGPAHFVSFQGLAASSADVFETPLGPVPVDTSAITALLRLPQVQVMDEAHAREHSLEVHLPFLQETLGDFQLIPLVVGQATPAQVSEVLETVWGGPETLIVISSDLSHYHPYDTACRLDRETSLVIEQGRVGDLRGDRACGFLAVGGLLESAAQRGLHARTIDLRNSGDTAGGRDQVVGYGAYVLEPDTGDETVSVLSHAENSHSDCEPAALSAEHEQQLLDVAATAIQRGIEYGAKPETNAADFPQPLQLMQATFVTLTCGGQLRGCIGSLLASRPLVCDVASNAYSAAFLDPRFSPLTLHEADSLEIHISVLSVPEAMSFESEDDAIAQLRPGIDGVTIYEANRRGTLLPAVWEKIPDPRTFFETVKKKAGLPADYWSATLRVERYTATSIGHET